MANIPTRACFIFTPAKGMKRRRRWTSSSLSSHRKGRKFSRKRGSRRILESVAPSAGVGEKIISD
jgi:hypothetical protein